ncbi:O-Methyltransferase [Sphaerulina musiva]
MSLKDLADHIDGVLNDQGSTSETVDDESERKRMLALCERLRDRLESPFEKTLRILFAGHQTMGLRLAVDMKVFDAAAHLSAQGEPVSLASLASETGVDGLLLRRIMRMLVAMRLFEEPAAESYVPLAMASAYLSQSPLSAVTIHVSHFYTILAQLPEYFAEKGWKNPNDVYDGPFQYAMHTKEHYFNFLASKPYYQEAFNTVMTLSHRRRGQNWFSFFPVEEKLQVHDPSRVVMVDVGGSQGGDITAFHDAFPALVGKLVLQDLPGVIEGCKQLPDGIEAMGYDFFDPQPVKGAKAYYLRTVLHDWPNKQAVQILKRVREAMAPDSLLLINETILPDCNVALSSAQADLTMMVSFASLERTQEQFEEILEDAGFELSRVWVPQGFESNAAALAEQATLLEARLKQ